METLSGRFTFGGAPSTLKVVITHAGEARHIALARCTLHLPPDHRTDADGYTPGDGDLLGDIAYDREPGVAGIEVLLAPTRGPVSYQITATLDGHELYEQGVTGGETHLSWRTRLPTWNGGQMGEFPSGAVYAVTLDSAVSAAGVIQAGHEEGGA